MLVSTFRMEDDQTPYVFSMPPHIDSEGDEVAAYVSVRPFGKDSRDVAINMSIVEAEELARQLVAVVTDARGADLVSTASRSPKTCVCKI